MPLLKPTRKDLVRAIVDQTRQQLYDESKELSRQAQELRNQGAERTKKLQEQAVAKAGRSLQPVVDELNAVLVKHGYPEIFRLQSFNAQPGKPITVTIGYNGVISKESKAVMPKSPEEEELYKQAFQLDQRARTLNVRAADLSENDVINGRIAEALNGKAEALFGELVKLVRDTAIEVDINWPRSPRHR